MTAAIKEAYNKLNVGQRNDVAKFIHSQTAKGSDPSALKAEDTEEVVAEEPIRDPFEVDLARTRIIVTAWPDNRWPVEITDWIEDLMRGVTRKREDFRASVNVQYVTCARNRAVKEYALASHEDYEWFIFLDHDIRPTAHTRMFLDLKSDVKSCQCKMYQDTAWCSPTAFHEAIWCTSRRVLEAIKPPWFMQAYSDDGCHPKGCICNSFRQKVLDAGFSIAHGGWAEHDRDSSWC